MLKLYNKKVNFKNTKYKLDIIKKSRFFTSITQQKDINKSVISDLDEKFNYGMFNFKISGISWIFYTTHRNWFIHTGEHFELFKSMNNLGSTELLLAGFDISLFIWMGYNVCNLFLINRKIQDSHIVSIKKQLDEIHKSKVTIKENNISENNI